ncbi:MobV family relaxase, partial [Streptomyces cyaneofuscatus]|uniref:MobV family relaxase n=1 Tax=Streptomyces cyaneofuscatus TaxID=66883 RepID=UPI00364BD6E2
MDRNRGVGARPRPRVRRTRGPGARGLRPHVLRWSISEKREIASAGFGVWGIAPSAGHRPPYPRSGRTTFAQQRCSEYTFKAPRCPRLAPIMSYAILRTAKLKTMGNIGASLSHTYRTRDTKNADPNRANKNRFQHKTADDVLAGINARLPAKRRKDAVLAIEYLVASSPDHFTTEAQHMAYLKDAWEWLKDRHGSENVVSAAIHMDEKTPHLVAYVVPIDGAGKLNAKAFLGGRQVLSQMQTDFAKQVGQKHGLERGIERSTATHTSVKEWYGLLNQSMKPVEVPPAAVVPKVKKKRAMLADIVETPEEVAARLNRTIARITEPVMASAKLARQERKTATELRDQVADMQRRLQAAEDLARQVETESKPLREVY